MQDARLRYRASLTEASDPTTGRFALRLRLFGLLALLVPLFGGLHYLVDESAPRVEVRLVPQAPAVADASQPPSERIVERVVYVPVERDATTPLNASSADAPAAQRRVEPASPPILGGLDTANAPHLDAAPARLADEQSAPDSASAVEPDDAPTPHMGLLAVATPVAAPVEAAAPVTARPVIQAPRYIPPVPVAEPDEPIVADDDGAAPDDDGDVVAEAPAAADDGAGADDGNHVAQVQVIDSTIEADQSVRVTLYRVPVQTDGTGDSPEATAPATDDPGTADTPDEAPAGDAQPPATEAAGSTDDGQRSDDDANAVQATGSQDDELASEPPAADDDAGKDSDDTTVADDGQNAAHDVPQISVTVLATTSGGFVSEGDPGQ